MTTAMYMKVQEGNYVSPAAEAVDFGFQAIICESSMTTRQNEQYSDEDDTSGWFNN